MGKANGASVGRHVFACLVHEKPEVVADLVCNLQALEPAASILLYDGSSSGRLLADERIPREPPVFIHPAPRPMHWGRLHGFAIDSMRYALAELDFDALTIVDSDQLLLRPGYVERVAQTLANQPDVGMLGNSPDHQPRSSRVDPVRTAWREFELWRRFLGKLPGGEESFVHWTFWPSTVFTRAAADDLVDLFKDGQLHSILRRSRIWATEEIILPTLVAALGHRLARHPASFEYVRYRTAYATADIDRALTKSDAFWIHPIPRQVDHPLRSHIRRRAVEPAETPGSEEATGLRVVPSAARAPAPSTTPPRRDRTYRGLDGRAVDLLEDLIGRTGSIAGRPRIAAPPGSTPIGAAVRDLMAVHGIAGPAVDVDPATGMRPRALDLAVLDDAAGLMALAERAMAAVPVLRPGAALVVIATGHRSGEAAGLVRTLAAGRPGSTVVVDQQATLLRTDAGTAAPRPGARGIPPIRALVERTLGIEGWLEPDEAVLLALTAATAVAATNGQAIVELGSFCGRGTALLGGVARTQQPTAQVHAVDRFDGIVGEVGGRTYDCGETLERFRATIGACGLEATVETHVTAPSEATWASPIGLLLVDAFHDYASVARDFRHSEPWLASSGLVAFHDYASYYPGVRRFVDELIADGHYVQLAKVRSLIVLGPAPAAGQAAQPSPSVSVPAAPADPARDRGRTTRRPRSSPPEVPREPTVSCIMPTYDRRAWVPGAIDRFLAQDYPQRELIVIDDGTDPVADLMPSDPRIRYVRVPNRMTIGAKRNLGCEIAGGELFAHWDDDDWVASWRLRYEVGALLGSEADIVGLTTLLYYDPSSAQAWRYAYRSTDRPWLHDPTFCLRREVWEAERFPDTNHGLDLRYLQTGRRKRISALADHRFYVGTIHAGNTSRKETRGASWRSIDGAEVRALMAADGRTGGLTVPSGGAPGLVAF